VIVRISTEGQYEVSDGDVEALNELDNAAVTACESGDEQNFKDTYAKLLDLVRSKGRPLGDDDELEGSDVIFPPPDISLEEARADFSGDGLIPD
jgi:hypothetical protein